MDSAPRKWQEERERYETSEHLEDWPEAPVMILGVAWLILLVVGFIWGVFVFDFLIRFILASWETEYLHNNSGSSEAIHNRFSLLKRQIPL